MSTLGIVLFSNLSYFNRWIEFFIVLFFNFLVMNDIYVTSVTPRYKKSWFITWFLLLIILKLFALDQSKTERKILALVYFENRQS